MPKTKDEIEEAEDAWALVARDEGHRCERCGEIVPHSERERFFETRLCAWCELQAEKED